jgi:hypothetical protein
VIVNAAAPAADGDPFGPAAPFRHEAFAEPVHAVTNANARPASGRHAARAKPARRLTASPTMTFLPATRHACCMKFPRLRRLDSCRALPMQPRFPPVNVRGQD